MKNSIGSLAALAALSAPALAAPAEPGPMIAAPFAGISVAFSDVGQVDFDFNNDSTRDFYLFGNSGVSVRLGSDSLDPYYIAGLTFGQEFNGADTFNTGSPDLFNAGQSGYYGIAFSIAGDTHYGWINLVVDDVGDTVTVQSGAWQSVAYATATTGAIPEPATAGALLGAAALAVTVAQRRRPRS